jgi:phosphoglycolate phosphatase
MVGDRDQDVNGAREQGFDCIGVLYGYGGIEELEGSGAKYIAETVEDILKFI